MKKIIFIGLISLLLLCNISLASLLFKMEADKTELLPGEQTTISLFAFADDPAATGLNGLNAWQLSALVSTDGVVEVVPGSVQFIAPSPWSNMDTGYNSINSPDSGTVSYLHLMTQDLPQDSVTGVGGYHIIAQFDIIAVGTLVGQQVTYTLGDNGLGFLGMLRDHRWWMGESLDGVFDVQNSQNTFTIVPEPSSVLIISGLALMGIIRRRKI